MYFDFLKKVEKILIYNLRCKNVTHQLTFFDHRGQDKYKEKSFESKLKNAFTFTFFKVIL